MELTVFLEKQDIRKIGLFKFLEASYQQRATFSDISENLNISDFILLNTVDELTRDIEANQLTDCFKLEKTEKHIILKKSGKASVQVLAWLYLKKSHSFKILDEIYRGTFTNIASYSESNFVSYTSVYNRIQELKKILRSYEIELSSRFKLIGDEMKIRMYFYQVYYERFNRIEFPFEPKKKEVNMLFIQQLEEQLEHSFSEVDKAKLDFFLAVNLNRIQQGTDLHSSTVERKKINVQLFLPIYEKIQGFLMEQVHLINQNHLISESKFILAFLISENMLSLNQKRLEPLIKNEQLTDFFLEEFSTFFENKVEKNYLNHLKSELMILHFKVLYFEKIGGIFEDAMSSNFIKENYLDAFLFCQQFIKTGGGNKKFKSINKNSDFLFRHYLFLIIEVFPPDFFMKSIKIYIDFSLGKHYNSMVSANVKTFSFLNIEVIDEMNQGADLVLSDYYFADKRKNCDYLVWNVLPTPADWANLGAHLTKIKRNREAEVNLDETT
ncbi:helix-turn-helix domain-containing protein [Carnobacterium maltaromaticum]|uniref:helix-turn-helix domain-containing protein n=1 Tax=Carnobacterium maltaromaticum TaxID=2751 RepID=UPI00295E7429|nr:helix-turn-helix domain-containing protein [Carnobacterium maltaromaticum]